MSERVRALLPTLNGLTAEEKAEVVEYLMGEFRVDEFQSREEWEEYWIAECNRRIADLEAGRTRLIPGDEVMRQLKEKYG